ncbi:hypothetical protein GMOD_00000418 [Pyrenophora seminiperda CCB06]|uniref:Uncharacterized protein n=1 Tax=Pyrenophora seminiperda CCB06 TaxID=1302712 RepID=A0A3M7M7G9_9PLEO|nr:hypothetical protein GMOD_00000418 [Pyrenophora seminiperda CCB06]
MILHTEPAYGLVPDWRNTDRWRNMLSERYCSGDAPGAVPWTVPNSVYWVDKMTGLGAFQAATLYSVLLSV